MESLFTQNKLTTIFGIIAGLPLLVAGSGIVLDAYWGHILTVVGGLGMVGLGIVAKAYNSHSTVDQVQQATVKAEIKEVEKEK